MNRQTLMLSALGVVVTLVAYFFLVWSPKNAEIADLHDQTEQAISQQGTIRSRIQALQEVRSRAPEIEASLAAAEAVVPHDAALPSALRQLQSAADDAGVELVSVSAGRPAAASGEGTAAGLSQISMNVQVNGSYFQTVDFLRRIADPSITPRGVVWSATALAPSTYPTLSVSLSGTMYAVLAGPPAEQAPQQNKDQQQSDVTNTSGTPAADTTEDAA